MKLLYCKRCHDIIKMSHRLNTCECGQVKGMYTSDLNVEYTGAYAVPLGILNDSFIDAVRNQPEKDNEERTGGVRFEGFVIPKQCSRVTRLT